jgi:hypothetical protein
MSQISDVQLYDIAVASYLAEVSGFHNRIYYAVTSMAKEKCSKENRDKTVYPFGSFYREPDLTIDESRFNSSVIPGFKTRMLVTNNTTGYPFKTEYVHSIPVNLLYQVDVWAARMEDALLISQELLLDLKSIKPVLLVPINPDGENGRFTFLDVSLTDNSDLESEDDNGKVYRYTFSFLIEAYIKNAVQKDSQRFNPNDNISIY